MSLETYIPEKTISIRNENILITPVKVKHFKALGSAITPILSSGMTVVDIIENVSSIKEVVKVLINKSSEWLDDLYLDEFIDISNSIMEVNKDFFIQRRVEEKILTLMETITTIVTGMNSSQS